VPWNKRKKPFIPERLSLGFQVRELLIFPFLGRRFQSRPLTIFVTQARRIRKHSQNKVFCECLRALDFPEQTIEEGGNETIAAFYLGSR